MPCSAQPCCHSELLHSVVIHTGVSPSSHPKATTPRSKSSISPVGRGKSKGGERRVQHYLFIQETGFGTDVVFHMFFKPLIELKMIDLRKRRHLKAASPV